MVKMNRILKCDKYKITQYFSSNHKGIDIVGRKDDKNTTCPIKAHTDGKVIWIQTGQKNNPNAKPGTNATYGNCVKLKHNNGYSTLYAHMAKVYVKLNQTVKEEQEIGYMGNTGRSFGAHLHWEVRKPNEERINPLPYINADLPGMGKKYYQTYDNVKNKWLPKVEIGSNDYAGNKGNGQSGLKCDGLTYRVHDRVKNKWLPWVTGSSDYAGNLPNDFDAIQFKQDVTYRVWDNAENKWLPWVTGTKDYAGNYGHSIGGVQIK